MQADNTNAISIIRTFIKRNEIAAFRYQYFLAPNPSCEFVNSMCDFTNEDAEEKKLLESRIEKMRALGAEGLSERECYRVQMEELIWEKSGLDALEEVNKTRSKSFAKNVFRARREYFDSMGENQELLIEVLPLVKDNEKRGIFKELTIQELKNFLIFLL